MSNPEGERTGIPVPDRYATLPVLWSPLPVLRIFPEYGAFPAPSLLPDNLVRP